MGLLTPVVSRLSVIDKKLRVVRFKPNWAQQILYSTTEHQLATRGRVRLIVLKARQLGISTATGALGYSLCFTRGNYRSLIVAHDTDSSEGLLEMQNRFWDTDPFKPLFTTKYESRKTLAWNETGSQMRIATAKNKAAGRSKTIHFLHASEVAFWESPDETALSLYQAIPEVPLTAVVLESTANGQGNFFHTEWLKAVGGDSEYTPLFFPWHRHPEYRGSQIGLPVTSLGKMSDEEKVLRSIGIDDDRLTWRRHAIKNLTGSDMLKFHQEYPTTPEEAFISTGSNVFPSDKLAAHYMPMLGETGTLVRDSTRIKFLPGAGPLTIFKRPSRDRDHGMYIIGADPTHTTGGDYAVAQVLNRRTLEQVAIYRLRVDPGTFADELFNLGSYYNDALIVPEKEGPGYMTVGKLLGMNYHNVYRHSKPDNTPGKIAQDTYGWSTNSQTKHLAVSWLLKYIVDARIGDIGLLLHDQGTYAELRGYVTMKNGGYGNADNSLNDDTVMSLAIAVTGHTLDGPIPPYGTMRDTRGLPPVTHDMRPTHPKSAPSSTIITTPDPDITPEPPAPWESWAEHPQSDLLEPV